MFELSNSINERIEFAQFNKPNFFNKSYGDGKIKKVNFCEGEIKVAEDSSNKLKKQGIIKAVSAYALGALSVGAGITLLALMHRVIPHNTGLYLMSMVVLVPVGFTAGFVTGTFFAVNVAYRPQKNDKIKELAFADNIAAEDRIKLFQENKNLFKWPELYGGYYRKIFNGSLPMDPKDIAKIKLEDVTEGLNSWKQFFDVSRIAVDAAKSEVLKEHNLELQTALIQKFGKILTNIEEEIPADCVKFPKLNRVKILPKNNVDLDRIGSTVTDLSINCYLLTSNHTPNLNHIKRLELTNLPSIECATNILSNTQNLQVLSIQLPISINRKTVVSGVVHMMKKPNMKQLTIHLKTPMDLLDTELRTNLKGFRIDMSKNLKAISIRKIN